VAGHGSWSSTNRINLRWGLVYQSIYLYVYLSIYISGRPSYPQQHWRASSKIGVRTRPRINRSIDLYLCISIYLSIDLSILVPGQWGVSSTDRIRQRDSCGWWPHVSICVYPSIYPSIHLSIYLSIYLFILAAVLKSSSSTDRLRLRLGWGLDHV